VTGVQAGSDSTQGDHGGRLGIQTGGIVTMTGFNPLRKQYDYRTI
jgi:hypothetical protein